MEDFCTAFSSRCPYANNSWSVFARLHLIDSLHSERFRRKYLRCCSHFMTMLHIRSRLLLFFYLLCFIFSFFFLPVDHDKASTTLAIFVSLYSLLLFLFMESDCGAWNESLSSFFSVCLYYCVTKLLQNALILLCTPLVFVSTFVTRRVVIKFGKSRFCHMYLKSKAHSFLLSRLWPNI